MHPTCTTAERKARELVAALEALRPHVLHQHVVDGDLFEARMILDHLRDHSEDLHVLDRRTMLPDLIGV